MQIRCLVGLVIFLIPLFLTSSFAAAAADDPAQGKVSAAPRLSLAELSFDELLTAPHEMSDLSLLASLQEGLWAKFRSSVTQDVRRSKAHAGRRIEDGDKTM